MPVSDRPAHRRAALLLVALLLPLSCAPGDPPVRNVILISIDTLRADRLGAYGHESPTSPALDALASGGVLFEDAISTAPWTLPAHVSLLTGLYPRSHGVRTHINPLSRDIPTLATLLASRGFDSSAHVNAYFMEPRFGFSRGFGSYTLYNADQTATGATGRIIKGAQTWLEGRGERPVFLFLHFYDVHSDYRSQPHYEKMFAPEPNRFDGNTMQMMMAMADQITPPIQPEEAAHLARLYDAGIRQLDDQLGGFVQWLEARGEFEDTLLVVTSDHGEEFLEHGSLSHGLTHYEEILRVPLILHGPGLPAGLRISTPVSLVDLLPTLLGQLGLPSPSDLDGRDLAPLWNEDGEHLEDRLLLAETGSMYDDALRSIRKGRLKLILDRKTGKRELYDLATDADERHDLIDARPELASELDAALRLEMSTARKPLPATWELSDQTKEHLKSLGYLTPGE